MERFRNITIIFLLAVGLLNSIAPPICFANRSSGTKPASVLLQEGLYAEQIDGDLDAAIKIYRQVIAAAKETQRAAAQATYRIGMCYLKKGEKGKAAGQFRDLIVKFPEHESLVINAGKQLAKLKPIGGFGPVIERIIYSEETGKPFFFDLDTAKAFSPPPGLTRTSPPRETIEWSRTKGVDFVNDRGHLELAEMTAVKVESDMWESATPAEIKDVLLKGSTQNFLPTHSKDYTISSPITYAFETRESGIGLLQILEKKNQNLRIRYKMLQELEVRGLSVSSHRKLLDERTLIAISNQDQFGAKWFKVEEEYENASQDNKQQMIRKWMADAQKPDVKIRSSAIASLGNIACKQATNLLLKIAQEPLEFSRSNRPRWIAVRGLGRIGDTRAVPVLIDLLDHYNKDTQLYSRVALAEITGLYFGADKAKWRKWWREKGKKLAELDLGSPQSTVINFTKAAIAGHVELALACFAPDSYDYEDVKELLTGAETNPLRMMLDAVDPDARIIIVSMEMAEEGTRCSIEWRMFLKRGFIIEGQTFKAGETFDLDGNLKKVGDRWLIVGI